MGNSVKVALINAAGEIVIKSGAVGVATNMRSSLQVVAMYITYDDPTEVTVRHKGKDSFGCEMTADGETCVYERTLSGSGKGAKVITYTATGTPTTRTIEAGVEDVVASAEMCWDTYEGGSGSAYENALADADAAVGYP